MSLAEERLREYSHIGDEMGVLDLIRAGVDVNSQNQMNGWSALHWAAARNHKSIVKILLQNKADPNIKNKKGETPGSITKSMEIKQLLGESNENDSALPTLPIVPNYIKHPVLPVVVNNEESNIKRFKMSSNDCENKKIILKIRQSGEDDFYEVELDKTKLNYEMLVDVCCEELNVNKEKVLKIRKLPNVVIRKNADVERLTDHQEIEVVCDV